MTRKKFVKRLMALGIPRNVAARDARDCQRQKLEYSHELARLRRFLLYMVYLGKQVPPNFLEVLPYE